jgi:hypothetical protein
MKGSDYTCHSGGAIGADLCWELEGEKYGVKTIAYSFKYHDSISPNLLVLSEEELNEGWQYIKKADETLKRNVKSNTKPYIYRLLCRNWFQVKNSDSILAIGEFSRNKKTVAGGTGWAVQMGIDNDKDVYLFNQVENQWYIWLEPNKLFVPYYDTPKLTKNFAGIGTRNLNKNGVAAIEKVYKNIFQK